MTVVVWFIRFIYYPPMAIEEAIFMARLCCIATQEIARTNQNQKDE